jgi:hypothetical protein
LKKFNENNMLHELRYYEIGAGKIDDYINHARRVAVPRCGGTLWEGRFRSSLTQSEVYALACYRYIELNPVRGHGAPPARLPPVDLSRQRQARRACERVPGLVGAL